MIFSVDELAPLDFEYFNYLAKYNKVYETREEFNMRAAIFKANHMLIMKFNAEPGHTHMLGHNAMSDYTEAEWEGLRGLAGWRADWDPIEGYTYENLLPSANTVAWSVGGMLQNLNGFHAGDSMVNQFKMKTEVDWRKEGVVTPVKD